MRNCIVDYPTEDKSQCNWDTEEVAEEAQPCSSNNHLKVIRNDCRLDIMGPLCPVPCQTEVRNNLVSLHPKINVALVKESPTVLGIPIKTWWCRQMIQEEMVEGQTVLVEEGNAAATTGGAKGSNRANSIANSDIWQRYVSWIYGLSKL